MAASATIPRVVLAEPWVGLLNNVQTCMYGGALHYLWWLRWEITASLAAGDNQRAEWWLQLALTELRKLRQWLWNAGVFQPDIRTPLTLDCYWVYIASPRPLPRTVRAPAAPPMLQIAPASAAPAVSDEAPLDLRIVRR